MPNFETDEEAKKAKEKEEEEKAKKEKAEKEKAEKAAKEEEEKKKAEKAKEEEDKYPSPESKKAEKAVNPAALAGMLSGLKGAPADALKELVDWLKEQKGSPESKKTTKSESESEDVPLFVMHADGRIEVGQSALEKRLQFTSGRTGTLKEAAMNLMKLLNDVDKEAAAEISATIKELPSDVRFDSQVRPVGVKKDEDVESLKAENVELRKRLDAIETTRAPSKEAGGDGTAEEVKKSDSVWAGIL